MRLVRETPTWTLRWSRSLGYDTAAAPLGGGVRGLSTKSGCQRGTNGTCGLALTGGRGAEGWPEVREEQVRSLDGLTQGEVSFSSCSLLPTLLNGKAEVAWMPAIERS